jgi:hypothetical protein
LAAKGGMQGRRIRQPEWREQPSGEIEVCCKPPQTSCCVARISISEMAKRNRTATLIRLMTAKGMFSRYRTYAPIDRTPCRLDA